MGSNKVYPYNYYYNKNDEKRDKKVIKNIYLFYLFIFLLPLGL